MSEKHRGRQAGAVCSQAQAAQIQAAKLSGTWKQNKTKKLQKVLPTKEGKR